VHLRYIKTNNLKPTFAFHILNIQCECDSIENTMDLIETAETFGLNIALRAYIYTLY
jgi:hypothetical protein